MPIISDFGLGQQEDGTLSIGLTPPTVISGWSLRFFVTKRFGGVSGLIQAYAASGFNNVSGINVVNGQQGIFQVSIPSVATSGMDAGNLSYTIARLDSGSRTILSEGYILLTPQGGP